MREGVDEWYCIALRSQRVATDAHPRPRLLTIAGIEFNSDELTTTLERSYSRRTAAHEWIKDHASRGGFNRLLRKVDGKRRRMFVLALVRHAPYVLQTGCPL